jgi:hypothetical protein
MNILVKKTLKNLHLNLMVNKHRTKCIHKLYYCRKLNFNITQYLIVPVTKRRKSSPSITDPLKLSRRSARNKASAKVNESTLVKSVWNIMPQHLLYDLFSKEIH